MVQQTIWSNPSPMPTVAQVYFALRTLELHSNHDRIRHCADLSELNWGMNQFEVWTGKANAIPDCENNPNGQNLMGKICGLDCSTSLVKTYWRKAFNYICSLKRSNRHQYSVNLQKICSGKKFTPCKWRHHSRWHQWEQMRHALLRQQPLLRVRVAAAP